MALDMSKTGPIPLLTPKALPKPFRLRIHDLLPSDIVPNGDRYIVETLDVDEDVLTCNGLLVPVQAVDPRNGQPSMITEYRGVAPAVVVMRGNGHLLGLSDHAVVMPEPTVLTMNEGESTEAFEARKAMAKMDALNAGCSYVGDHSIVVRPWASVPMFFDQGTIVFIDINAKGREFRLFGRAVRVVDQINILAHTNKIKLVLDADGNWTQPE